MCIYIHMHTCFEDQSTIDFGVLFHSEWNLQKIRGVSPSSKQAPDETGYWIHPMTRRIQRNIGTEKSWDGENHALSNDMV